MENIVVKAQYIESKIDNNTYCKINGHFTRHLRKNNLTYKDYFEMYITGITPLCACNKPLTFYQTTESYAGSCGEYACVGKSISNTKRSWTAEEKVADSNNKKLAAKNKTPEQKQQKIEKTQATFMEKCGVNWGAKSEIQKEKARKTKLEKYGDEYYNNSETSRIKNKNKSVEEKEKINQLRRETNLERYGVECVFLKSGNVKKVNKGNASIKPFQLPSGKIIGVRGYEPNALKILLSSGYNEDDLIIHDDYCEYSIEIFEYVAVNRHTQKYYPDIYIPKEHKIIEVKSRWWWDGNGDPKYVSRLLNNLKKRQSVLEKGYNYELWLFTDNKNYKIIKNESDF